MSKFKVGDKVGFSDDAKKMLAGGPPHCFVEAIFTIAAICDNGLGTPLYVMTETYNGEFIEVAEIHLYLAENKDD